MEINNLSSNEYFLREPSEENLEELLTLITDSMRSYSRDSGIDPSILDSMHETCDDLRKKLQTHRILCYFDSDSHPVGTITLKIREDLTSLKYSDITKDYIGDAGKVLYISRFAVLDTLRGTGLGVKLLDEAAEYAKENGVDLLILHTAVRNTGRVEFYINRGFELIDSESSRGYERGLFGKRI